MNCKLTKSLANSSADLTAKVLSPSAKTPLSGLSLRLNFAFGVFDNKSRACKSTAVPFKAYEMNTFLTETVLSTLKICVAGIYVVDKATEGWESSLTSSLYSSRNEALTRKV